jgi:hypothetical protein
MYEAPSVSLANIQAAGAIGDVGKDAGPVPSTALVNAYGDFGWKFFKWVAKKWSHSITH